jgi:lysophospholipase L1-like esterase
MLLVLSSTAAAEKFSAPILEGDSWSNAADDWPGYTSTVLYSEFYSYAIDGHWLSARATSPVSGVVVSVSDHLAWHPEADSIIVAAGLNDFMHGVSSEVVQMAMVDIIDTIRAHNNVKDIIVVGPGPFADSSRWLPANQIELENYLTWLPAYSSSEGLHYYDAYSAVGDPDNPEHFLPAYAGSGAHLNEVGAIVVAGEIDALITQVRNSPIVVEILVTPWGTIGEVKPESNDPITVAIFSASQHNPDFGILDATQIDPDTLRLGFGQAANTAGLSFVDVDSDEDMDTVAIFDTQDTGVLCEDTEITLQGETLSGEPFIGTGQIVATDCANGVCHP